MPYLIILIGFVFLIYVISKYMEQSNSVHINKAFRFGFALVLGLLAYFFLVMAKNIPVGAILSLLSYLSARGTLWRFLMNKKPGSDQQEIDKFNRMKPMTREEALDILGLSGHPDETDIKDAHRKMMMKLHPDQGGSDYFASKLNQARDILLA